jgi:hypothetical protein
MKPGRPTTQYSPTPTWARGHQAVYAGPRSCVPYRVSAPTPRWHSRPPATSRRRCRPARHLRSTRRACSRHLLVCATPLCSSAAMRARRRHRFPTTPSSSEPGTRPPPSPPHVRLRSSSRHGPPAPKLAHHRLRFLRFTDHRRSRQ